MENKTSSGYEKLERSENEITGNSDQLSHSRTPMSYLQELATDDILLEDFPEEEIFVLSERYVSMEDEYVMWEESTQSKGNNLENDYEGQLMLPFEDSLHSLGEYFTVKKVSSPIHHN
ncbi:MAG: hypothetical protein ACM3PR_02680 [Bacteroidales bacterium]